MDTHREIPLHATVVADRQHVACDLAGETVILSLKTGEYFGLNPVAARVWELIQERRTILVVRDQLLDEYEGVEAGQCTQDLLGLIRQLGDWGLVHISNHKG